MDNNKLIMLRAIGYKVNKCCGLCKHGTFPNNNWGTCKIHKYEHLKHTGEARELSINKFGVCGSFEEGENISAELGKFAEFMVQ